MNMNDCIGVYDVSTTQHIAASEESALQVDKFKSNESSI